MLSVLLASCNRPTGDASNPRPALTGNFHPTPPPLGTYRCWTGGFDHLPAGTLTLAADGHYESYRPNGGGRYSFSPATSTIDFQDGDYNYWEYRAVFQPATQSGENRERLVLTPIDSTIPIGAERPGFYQYCYPESLDSPHSKSNG